MNTMTKALHAGNCCCPTCRGLATFERPLFGAGQILTAADLTSLQDYVRAKNRLHNRYLHGWGVACGLEVVCNDCEGSVTIQPGYAIDPCGADIVVAKDTRYDLVAAIRNCADQARAKTGDCDPWAPPPDPGCRDAESHWCISLKYREVETAYVRGFAKAAPAMASPAAECGCGGGCGCGGHCGGGCGCQSTGGKPRSASVPTVSRTSNNSCTPRRISECFDICLIESKDGCVPKLYRRGDDNTHTTGGLTGVWDDLIPTGTLLRKIVDCLLASFEAITDRVGQSDTAMLTTLATDDPAKLISAGVTPAQVHAAVCKYKAAIMDLLANDPHPVRCQLRKAAAEVTLAPPNPNTPVDTYFNQAKAALLELVAVWFQLMIDCICHAFIPQCDDDPCDDRVEIACVTVKAGKILDICNHSCRRYAGAFPSTFYWLSLVPILPLIGKLLAIFCCQPDLLRRNSPLVNDLVPLLDRVDPTGSLRRTVTANDFALPRRTLARLSEKVNTPLLTMLAKRFDIATAGVAHTGDKAAQAKGDLEAAGVKVEIKRLDVGQDADVIARMDRQPLLNRGDHAIVYTRDNQVVAVVREDDGEVATLRREVDELRRSVAALSKQRPAPPR